MNLTEREIQTLEFALYSNVSSTHRLYDNGNMEEETADATLADIRNICFKAGIKDQVAAYQVNEQEREMDEQIARDHDAYHNW